MPTSTRSKQPDVYAVLKNAIQFLEIMPGTILREADLIQKIGCSRTPIREALIRLADEYLVDIFPQRGTYVSQIDFNLANEVAYMRHLLDLDISLSLCKKKQGISHDLEQALALMQVAVKNQSVVDYIKNDNRFHHIIFKIAGHETIWNIIANSRAHYNRVLVLDLQRPGILSKSYEEHLEIIRCIENGLEKELRAVLISHHDTEDTQNRALEIRKAFPDYFPVEIF